MKEEIKEGVEIGGYIIPSPWDEDVPLTIERAVIRDYEGQLYAEHLKPQYDSNEVEDNLYWRNYILTNK